MKTISTALQERLEQEVVALATCWKITRRDNSVKGFTDYTSALSVDGVVYEAVSGFLPSAVESSTGTAVDNMDVIGMLNATSISEDDIFAGLYDYAEIDVFLIAPEHIDEGTVSLRSGYIGEITTKGGRFVAEVRGLTQALSRHIGELYSPLCRAKLGDAKCSKDLASHTVTSAVTSFTDRRVFTASGLTQADGYFDGGRVTFSSGDNEGLAMEVKRFSGGEVTLALPMPYALAASDMFTIIAGCDKTFATCIGTFNNAENFRGEPHVPGIDKMLETAGTRNKSTAG